MDLSQGWHIHPLFYIDRLKQYICLEDFLQEVEPLPPILIKDYLEYEVQDLIWHYGRGAYQQYLVLWKGYLFTKATSEYERAFKNALDILNAYLHQCRE